MREQFCAIGLLRCITQTYNERWGHIFSAMSALCTTRHGSFILSNDRVRSIHNAASAISVTLMSHGGLLPRVSIVTNGVYEFQFAL